MHEAKCPYCAWQSAEPTPDEVPPLLHAAMQLQEHLVDAHWLAEIEATEIADLWVAVEASQARA